LSTWLSEGGPTGRLGLPASEVSWRQVALPQAKWLDFQHGVLVQFGAEHPLGLPAERCHVITSLEFFLTAFHADENDQNNPDNPPDVYVNHYVAARHGDGEPFVLWEDRVPSEDGYWQDTRFIPFEKRLALANPMRGDVVIDVYFRGRDHDSTSGDDTLGELDFDYTVDTLWGIGEPDEHRTSTEDGEFAAFYVLKQEDIATDLNGNFRDRFFWQFDNFDTLRMSPELYDRTFVDVEPGLQFHINPLEYIREGWEHFFYHAAYKIVGKKGNCFGMSVEAIYAYYHRSAIAQPLFAQGHPQELLTGDFKGDPDPALDAALITQINIKHGYQLGAPAIRWYARQIVAGKINDGREVFQEARAAFDQDNWPVLCMVRKWKTSGHVVLPIKFVVPPDPAAPLEIWVADPSRRPAYDDPATPNDEQWKILIDRNDGSWRFRGSYNSAEPRWLFWMPYSLFKEPPRTPSWEALGVLAALFPPAASAVNTSFMLLGEAETHQISDANGHTLYLPGLGRAPESPLDLRADADGFIPGVSRIPFFGGEDGPIDAEMHIALGQHLALSHDIIGRPGGNYSWGMRTPGTAAIVTAPASSTADRINAEHLGTAARAISFQMANDVPDKQIALLMEALPRDRMPREHLTRQFLLEQLRLHANQRIIARVDDAGNDLTIVNQGPQTSFQLQMRGTAGTQLSRPRQLTLGGGKTVRLRPSDWSISGLDSAPIRVEVRNTPTGPAEDCFEI
jgi:hypothetical protein